MNVLTTIIHIAAIAFGVFGTSKDYNKSHEYEFYGNFESNKLFRDSTNRFANMRYIVAHVVLYGAIAVVGLVVPESRLVMSGILFALGGVRWLIAISNTRKNDERRDKQLSLITWMTNGHNDPDAIIDGQMIAASHGGRNYYIPFNWLDSYTSLEDARAKVKKFAVDYNEGRASFPA
jgi:hypothetical protein